MYRGQGSTADLIKVCVCVSELHTHACRLTPYVIYMNQSAASPLRYSWQEKHHAGLCSRGGSNNIHPDGSSSPRRYCPAPQAAAAAEHIDGCLLFFFFFFLFLKESNRCCDPSIVLEFFFLCRNVEQPCIKPPCLQVGPEPFVHWLVISSHNPVSMWPHTAQMATEMRE